MQTRMSLQKFLTASMKPAFDPPPDASTPLRMPSNLAGRTLTS